jgi:hypothetical protein
MPSISQYEGRVVLPVSRLVEAASIPETLLSFGGSVAEPLEQICYTDVVFDIIENRVQGSVILIFPASLEFSLAGIDSISFGIGEQGFIPVKVQFTWTAESFALLIENIELTLRFSREFLEPAEPAPAGGYKTKGVDERAKISASGSLYINQDFDIEGSGFDQFTLEPVKLPNLNSVYLVLEDVKMDLSRSSAIPEVLSAGFDQEFQGLCVRRLTVVFQDDLDFLPDITAENLAIGTGGISGKITATFDLNYKAADRRFEGDAAGELFGAAIGLRKFDLELRANEIVSSEITGQILLPFFDKPVEIELSFDLKGNISVGLKGTDGGVLVELTKDDIISMKVNSFAFSKQDGEIAFALGGSIKPLFGEGIDWPEFGVNNLILWRDPDDLKWGVKLEGGWIDFPKALSFSISGFRGELRKIGFGTIQLQGIENAFVGFSGSISFVSGFALAAEFEDLMLFYDPNIRVELERARIGLLVPNAISLVGEVTKREYGFGGMIDITVLPMEMRIFAGAEFGHKPPPEPFSYMQIFMGLELPPPGIMLGQTPLAIRGFEGKYAMNMEPSMDPGWEWAIAPPRGITPLSKMVPGKGGKMLGAGLKIATTDGWLLEISALFALILPGPVVMIEGRGGLFKGVIGGGKGGDPPFYALIVINGREQYFSANLSFNADLAKGIIRASGTVAAFFDLQDLSWYVKLGQKEPASKRISATAIKIFKSSAYFEVYSGPRLSFGADISIKASKNFAVGHARIKIYIGGGVDLSWKPEHAAGFLKFIAEIAIRICGFGLGIGLYGEIDAKTPYPRHLLLAAGFRLILELPWPFPDVNVKGKVEKVWRDGKEYPCTFEPLVDEVLVDSEIPGINAKRLVRYDSGTHPATLADDVPLVSMDARPTVRFTFPINDETELALAGNASTGPIFHRIDDEEYKFSLEKLTLEECKLPEDPAEFNRTLEAQFDPSALNWEEIEIPYGVFIADNSATGQMAATTLRLFSNTPFTHFRQSLFSGGIQTQYGIQIESSATAWLNSQNNESCVFNADTFIGQSETTLPTSASNLVATLEDQSPEYPLGEPTIEWRYIGFAGVPEQFQTDLIKVSNTLSIFAAPDTEGEILLFDVIDLHFLPPIGTMPGIHNTSTYVRGVYFEGAIKIQFSVPISECELYLYPVRRESSDPDHYPDDWPDEGKPENGKPNDIIFAGRCCEEALALIEKLIEQAGEDLDQTQLKELAEFLEDCCESAQICCEEALTLLEKLDEFIKEKETQAYLRKLAGFFEDCCEQKKVCCEEAFADIKELVKIVKEDEAQTLLREVAALLHDCCEKAKDCCEKILSQIGKLAEVFKDGEVQTLFEELVFFLNECCKQAPEQQLSDDEPFLSFEFDRTPSALNQSPPHIRTKRVSEGRSETVPHDETREITDNIYSVRISHTGTPFDEVEVLNTLPGYGLFLVAIGYLPDVEEHWEVDDGKTNDLITNSWTGDGDDPVVLSPRGIYRLTVRTKADCDPGAPHNHIYYFRTDGPPANNLKDYVAWTVPGFQQYPHFRKYDVTIRFGTNYADQLFPDLPLRLSLRSDAGQVLTTQLNNGLSWREEATHLLRPEEKAYIDLLNESGRVDQIDPHAIPGDKSLILTCDQEPLEADQGYTAVLDLPPESNFALVVATVKGVSSLFTQHMPTLMTAYPNPGVVTAGDQQLLGSSEDFDEVDLSTDTDGVLFQLKFRTSKFPDFSAMFTHLVNRQDGIQSISVSDSIALRGLLNSLGDICMNVWRPIRLLLLEKRLSVQRRLAKEEELLDVIDTMADACAQLDDAFSVALTTLSDLAGLILQPLPKKAAMHWSPDCILVELPEPVEFERISVVYDEFDVLVTCSSDESRWLIFPASSTDQFSRSSRLTISYRFNMGNDYPRLRYGAQTREQVVIDLAE